MEGADQAFYCRQVVYEHFKWLEGVAGGTAGVLTAAAAQLFYSRRGFNFQKETNRPYFLGGRSFLFISIDQNLVPFASFLQLCAIFCTLTTLQFPQMQNLQPYKWLLYFYFH